MCFPVLVLLSSTLISCSQSVTVKDEPIFLAGSRLLQKMIGNGNVFKVTPQAFELPLMLDRNT